MEFNNVLDGLQGLSLDPERLLFCPTGDKHLLLQKFDDIPRYLFRVYSPMSRGTTDNHWAKSMDARQCGSNRSLDIFARSDSGVAGMINRHLRWMQGSQDNLVSWTSSLLFAIIYIFYLHASSRDGSAFDDIYLCIVDTTGFAKGVFLRDMDLIRAYSKFNEDLQRFEDLRSKQHRAYSGSYYFGEYLSQGALRIEDNCQIVSAQAMIVTGLYNLHPEFEEFGRWEMQDKPPWADLVIRLREDFYKPPVEWPEISAVEQEAAINIAQLFGQRWRLPMAANLIAMLPRRIEDGDILQAFKIAFTEHERTACSPRNTKIVPYHTLPEVQQYNDVMHGVYKDYCFAQLKDYTAEAESQLRCAIIMAHSIQMSTSASEALTDIRRTALLQRLDMITDLSQSVRHVILARRERDDAQIH
ncbi:hypothetical protein B0T14DRAFT_208177 [Immersiella caudata]|uniref:DUF7587 domain-containing protein n=1 Tax=Immersiella caudata TaxID=314043 RepID=A0AA39WPX0_9PEZI|nr:hypothetical protein B0T14DRAFT_208177 [Immersiella caudata]